VPFGERVANEGSIYVARVDGHDDRSSAKLAFQEPRRALECVALGVAAFGLGNRGGERSDQDRPGDAGAGDSARDGTPDRVDAVDRFRRRRVLSVPPDSNLAVDVRIQGNIDLRRLVPKRHQFIDCCICGASVVKYRTDESAHTNSPGDDSNCTDYGIRVSRDRPCVTIFEREGRAVLALHVDGFLTIER
jgi:hypothetical protein